MKYPLVSLLLTLAGCASSYPPPEPPLVVKPLSFAEEAAKHRAAIGVGEIPIPVSSIEAAGFASEPIRVGATLPASAPTLAVAGATPGQAGSSPISARANSLRTMLAAWGSKEHWTVKWADGVEDIPLPPGEHLEGSLGTAAHSLSKLLPASAKLKITMYEGDKVIHVHPR